MLTRERGDDVVDDDVHRALPLLRIARRLAHARRWRNCASIGATVERVRESKLEELLAEARDAFRIRWLHVQLDEDRLDEARVAALVHPRERPAHHARCVGRLRPFLRRGREADELGGEAALADAGLAGDQHDLGPPESRGLIGEVEARELHPSTDERRGDLDARPHVGALADQRVREDRLVLALQLDRADLAEARTRGWSGGRWSASRRSRRVRRRLEGAPRCSPCRP